MAQQIIIDTLIDVLVKIGKSAIIDTIDFLQKQLQALGEGEQAGVGYQTEAEEEQESSDQE